MRSLLFVVALASSTACATFEVDGPFATPTGPVSPTPTPPSLYGDGRDGSRIVDQPATINACHAVVLAGGSTLELDSTAGIVAGNVLLIHQATGDFATMSGDPASVAITGSAGNWELVRVTAVSETAVALATSLVKGYPVAPRSVAQVCTVPEYTTLTILGTGTILAPPWNGATGGIVAFLASDALQIDLGGAIRADGIGFRGGLASGPSSNTTPGLDVISINGGGKGEGPRGGSYDLFGRGNYASGAGGGNGRAAGGGGGGNGGAGGTGGFQTKIQGDMTPNTQGLGGSPLSFAVRERLHFGGGGGGGHFDGSAGANGGAGGGIILLRVRTIAGSGTISANGNAGTSIMTGDGGAGGGAGGTIALFSNTFSYAGLLQAKGGNGGTITAGNGVNEIWGPGGGGGGGHIYFPGVGAANVFLTGGAAGTNTDQMNVGDQRWGSTAGAAGLLEP